MCATAEERWWRRGFWIRVAGGPSLRRAKKRSQAWRAATQAVATTNVFNEHRTTLMMKRHVFAEKTCNRSEPRRTCRCSETGDSAVQRRTAGATAPATHTSNCRNRNDPCTNGDATTNASQYHGEPTEQAKDAIIETLIELHKNVVEASKDEDSNKEKDAGRKLSKRRREEHLGRTGNHGPAKRSPSAQQPIKMLDSGQQRSHEGTRTWKQALTGTCRAKAIQKTVKVERADSLG